MNYLQRLATAAQQLGLKPGSVSTVHIQHDVGCPMLAGKKTCRCQPDITIETPGAKINVMPDGAIIQPAELN
jgi:hypothetical protein